jgi:nucleoside-diphosphate-sugar epimerase
MADTKLTRILLLGCGYTGLEVARQARARGLQVLATTRSFQRSQELAAAGAEPIVLSTLDAESLASHVDAHSALIVSFPPDGQTDARCAALARHAYASAYVSSTGVYGSRRGHIDDSTPAAPDTPRLELRLAAEQAWREAGATVLRAAAIYGPGRGMHERVRSGSARIAGDGRQHVCRIHVEDLARALLRSVELPLGPETYVVADDEPAPQGEVVRYLAQRLGVPCPVSVPLESAPETLRHDRRIDAARFKRETGISWHYPNYREGFEACLRAEQAERGSNVYIVAIDLGSPVHARSLLELLDHYARDPVGGGAGLSESVKQRLIPALRAQSRYLGFLAFEGERAIGLINCFVGFSTFAARPLLNVHDIVVHESARRRGVGRLLLARAEQAARESDCCKLTLEVLSGNKIALAAYAALGFEPYVLDPSVGSALLLEKKL